MNRQEVLANLGAFQNKKVLLHASQQTGDIIKNLLATHEKFSSEYKNIYSQFDGPTVEAICKNIWTFLKQNVRYWEEPENFQTLRSPAAIVATGKTVGADCKNYSLFTAGVLQWFGIPFAFRFASYRMTDKRPHHVFVVAYPGTKKEIWIDPVLPAFNEKKPYYYSIDKKPKRMLYQINGFDNEQAEIGNIFKKAGQALKKLDIKKVANVVLKIPTAPARNAFLLLIKLNFRSLAKNLKLAIEKNPGKVENFWLTAGGSFSALKSAVDAGAKKKRLGAIAGFDNEGYPLPSSASVGVVPLAAAPATVAAAAPFLVKVAELLKSIGIEPEDVGKAALNVASNLAKNAVNKISQEQEQGALSVDETGELQTNNVIPRNSPNTSETGMSNKTKKMLIIGGVGLAAFLLLTRNKK